MAEAVLIRAEEDYRVTAAAAVAAGEVWQLAGGLAAVYVGLNAAASGDRTNFTTEGQYTLPKTATVCFLDGGRAYWDASASKVHFKKVDDRDFYIGRFVGDAAGTDTTCAVNLNVNPPYDLELHTGPANSVLVGTPAALAVSFNYPRRLGSSNLYYLSATSEAQKVDLVSVDGFAKDANAIVEFAFRVPVGGSGSASDYSLGIANATHASDADVIADSVFVHVDGGSANIYLESDDGTTEVAATDSTIDWTAGLTAATRVEVWFDMRLPADVQIYLDGILMLGSTVFNVNAYAGPWYLITHLEKSTGTETADLIVDWFRARYSEQ